MIEGRGTTFDVSEQQLVDCVNQANGYSSGGCNGGYSGEPEACGIGAGRGRRVDGQAAAAQHDCLHTPPLPNRLRSR